MSETVIYSYFIWQPEWIIAFTIFSLVAWLATKSKDLTMYKVNGTWLGAAVAISSAWLVGGFAVATLAFFFMFKWVLEYWLARLSKNREAETK